MGFSWDTGPRVFLVAGVVLVLLAAILLLSAPQAAIYPLALGGASLLVAVAMAYDSRPRP